MPRQIEDDRIHLNAHVKSRYGFVHFCSGTWTRSTGPVQFFHLALQCCTYMLLYHLQIYAIIPGNSKITFLQTYQAQAMDKLRWVRIKKNNSYFLRRKKENYLLTPKQTVSKRESNPEILIKQRTGSPLTAL